MSSGQEIFVFGSNLGGRHGRGAAQDALRKYGAIYGQGVGRQGMSYGIPTKDGKLNVLSLERIRRHVSDFIGYALVYPDLNFKVTRIGTGLAGYKDEEIAPMFEFAPSNCIFDFVWARYLGSRFKYFHHEPRYMRGRRT
jgi:hypothetical protein